MILEIREARADGLLQSHLYGIEIVVIITFEAPTVLLQSHLYGIEI